MSDVQPQSLEAEQSVLGSMLMDTEAIPKAFQWLKPEHFYKDSHADIFRAILKLFNDSKKIDNVTVIEQLKKNEQLEFVGGAYYVSGLSESTPTSANVEAYAKIVLEKALLRELIILSHGMSQEAHNSKGDVSEIIERAEQRIFNIAQYRLRGGFVPIEDVVHDSFEILDVRSKNEGTISGIPTGLEDLDNLTAGLHKGELTTIASSTAVGKTSLALTIARNVAIDSKIPVGIFSLEMTKEELTMRLMTGEARIDGHLMRTGKLSTEDWSALTHKAGAVADAPIYIDDTPILTATEIRAKARRLKSEHDIGLVIVDYIQLLDAGVKTENRTREISVITRSMKALAKELMIPVIILSQLSRAVDYRNPPIPRLSDLRESGSIEHDSDVVMFIYRPFIHSKDLSDFGKADLIIEKQRNGRLGTCRVTYHDKFTKFEDYAHEHD